MKSQNQASPKQSPQKQQQQPLLNLISFHSNKQLQFLSQYITGSNFYTNFSCWKRPQNSQQRTREKLLLIFNTLSKHQSVTNVSQNLTNTENIIISNSSSNSTAKSPSNNANNNNSSGDSKQEQSPAIKPFSSPTTDDANTAPNGAELTKRPIAVSVTSPTGGSQLVTTFKLSPNNTSSNSSSLSSNANNNTNNNTSLSSSNVVTSSNNSLNQTSFIFSPDKNLSIKVINDFIQ